MIPQRCEINLKVFEGFFNLLLTLSHFAKKIFLRLNLIGKRES